MSIPEVYKVPVIHTFIQIISQDFYVLHLLSFIDRTQTESLGPTHSMTSCCSTAETNCLSGNEPNIFRKAVFVTGVPQCSETPIPRSVESQETSSVQCPCTCYLIGLIQIAPVLAAAETTDGQENLRFFDIILLFMKHPPNTGI